MVERTLHTLAVYLLGLSMVAAIQVKIPQAQYEVARGGNITLPCSFTSTSAQRNRGIVTWTMQMDQGEEVTIVSYYADENSVDTNSDYDGRVALEQDFANGKINLKLSKLTLGDNHNFECKVQIPGDFKGTTAAITKLVVLVAPSPPICKIQGKAEYGQDIQLTCVSEEGSPPPVYKWQSHDVKNTPRPNPPKATDVNGVLSLFNISIETSGYYICTSSNRIRTEKCNLTLSVMPPSMNVASTAGIIGGAVAALLVLLITIYCCCCRKKKAEEEYAMGEPEGGAFHDVNPADNKNESSERENHDKPLDRHDRPSELSDYDDRRSDYDDRRTDYVRRNDRSDRDDYNDRRERYDDRPNDRRDRYDDRYDDRYNDRYDDRRDRYNDRYDDRYDDRPSSRNQYGDRDRPPSVPPNKPIRDQ